MSFQQITIGREKAIELYDSGWWVDREARDVAVIGLMTEELCLPFETMLEYVSTALGRTVAHQELQWNLEGLVKELVGSDRIPTSYDIISLINWRKRTLAVEL